MPLTRGSSRRSKLRRVRHIGQTTQRLASRVGAAVARHFYHPVQFQILGAGACLVAATVGRAWAESKANEAFFEAAAQIIPVLLLILAFEARYFRFTPLHDAAVGIAITGAAWRLLVFVILMQGELASLEALMNGADGVNPEPVGGALWAGFLAVLLVALFGPAPTRHSRDS